MPTKIEWATESWNPVAGCTKVSPGCQNCYAERMAMRFTGHFNVTCHPDRLDQPLHWRKPRRIFVCSMGDLFHKDVPDEFLDRIPHIIQKCPRHDFLILTKRPERMHDHLKHVRIIMPNVWLGVTAENQEQADKRIPILLQIPAAKRFVSIEPMLQRVYLTKEWGDKIDWIIIGAESGPKRRKLDSNDLRWVMKHYKEFNIPIFIKQIDMGYRISKDPEEWSPDLRVRKYPG